ncbi:DEAD/DEAH box helicase [Rugosimonospora africana]|uniref:DEAD/DEAH box helicase n=1 Tax=Rugosimonospora africana TaxID=556532 RepID=A0A8J3VX12_9ACTN|nr:DEAD/DEAH box helicase [Rugosimonospora africana]GIH21401.1 hypothetical protein Raf01_95730 [Rugosimonospora africana]
MRSGVWEPANTGRPCWLKICDPDVLLPEVPPGSDIRVLLPDDERFTELQDKLAVAGADTRRVRYLLEDESIVATGDDDNPRLVAAASECGLVRPGARRTTHASGPEAEAARDAFDVMWQANAPAGRTAERPVPVDSLLPAGWARFLPFGVLNPAQVEAAPHVLDSDANLVVVAPTGAGKTVIGMMAALRTVVGRGRKAAWLVPQRSLTDELNQELELWRRQGLRVERLSGEYSVDVERARRADLWVATTEKFESVCRSSSLREALSEVDCLVVDEIHLLGDESRGPVLEALLARMRGRESGMRIVGLSATVANAEQIASWLQARLLQIAWRPSRLTWQLPMVATHSDWNVVEAARTRLAAAIADRVTADGGGVLVFCGSKHHVRRTALVIAGRRGADVSRVHPDDLDRLHEACQSVGVGLHYKGWEHRREAEHGFRTRQLSVLVATSTVAAGVNLPARAVIVRDTQLGLRDLDVATVQQMFGRAGRVGAGENRGWAFLIVDETQRTAWQSRLVAGHTVRSQILSSLADHILAEVVQRTVGSLRQAEQWWVQTLAYHQGSSSPEPLRRAVEFLAEAQLLAVTEQPDDDFLLEPTDLGLLTARMMLSCTTAHELRSALARMDPPADPDEAERLLIDTVAAVVPKLTQVTVSEDLKPAVARLLDAEGRLAGRPAPGGTDSGSRVTIAPGDTARAALLAVARWPAAFGAHVRQVAGVPYAAMYPALEEAPRYLNWLGGQGLLGTVHPWCAIVGADLGRRIRWRRCQPHRGAGRLLWICEQMATAGYIEDTVELWRAAVARGIVSPDWTTTARPRHCRLDATEYAALLRDRATGTVIDLRTDRVAARAPSGAALVAWAGRAHRLTTARRGEAILVVPDADPPPDAAAVFTWRGDYHATGWLSDYSQLSG